MTVQPSLTGEQNVQTISSHIVRAMDDLRKMYQATAIVCAGMIGSLFIYVAAVETTRIMFEEFGGFLALRDSEVVRYLFYGLAVMQLAIIRAIKARINEIKPSDVPSVIIGKLSRAAFLVSGLSEIPAVLGLLLFLLVGLHVDFYVLWFLSLLLMLMQFPRLAAWEHRARQARGMH